MKDKKTNQIAVYDLDSSNKEQIKIIADWYFKEWGTPIERTFSRLKNQPGKDLLFQLIALKESRLLATAGLGNQVGLLKVYGKFNHLKPWLALLYTEEDYRKQGIGKLLIDETERKAKALNLSTIYLYTFTAESLYTKCGWEKIDMVQYKGHDTVIMKKEL